MLLTELKETGIDYNNADSLRFQQYSRGYAAIDRLFPVSPAAVSGGWGDVMLRGGSVQSQSGGNISIMAPYGKVTVGYDSEVARNYGLGGVVSRRDGDVRIMADGSIDLHLSRVFTLQGGDLTMWTSNGNISAGSGAKTSVFNVPLKFSMDNDARVSVDAFGLSTGAGIGVLDATRSSDAAVDAPPPWATGGGASEAPSQEPREEESDGSARLPGARSMPATPASASSVTLTSLRCGSSTRRTSLCRGSLWACHRFRLRTSAV